MLKLFRTIRQNLLTENKVGRYLVYAVGEILLVVIGIIIAVQIGNWNEQSNRSQLELVLLEQIQNEINDLTYDVTSDLRTLLEGSKSHYRIIDYIQTDAPYADSMAFDFFWLIQDEYIYPQDAVYSRLKEKGLDIVKNDTLRILLQSLYESQYPRISKNSSFYPDIENFFSPYYQDHFKPNTDPDLTYELIRENEEPLRFPQTNFRNGMEHFVTIGYVPLNYAQLKRDPKFQMLMHQSREYRGYKIGRYRRTIDLIERINTRIDQLLGK